MARFPGCLPGDQAGGHPKGRAVEHLLIPGASRGIGLATARSLAQRGFRIVITARQESDLARAVADLRALHPSVSSFAGECSDRGVVKDLIRSIQRDFGRLDVVVNNAGGSHFLASDEASYITGATLPLLAERWHAAFTIGTRIC